jgi:hypothetical protein
VISPCNLSLVRISSESSHGFSIRDLVIETRNEIINKHVCLQFEKNENLSLIVFVVRIYSLGIENSNKEKFRESIKSAQET